MLRYAEQKNISLQQIIDIAKRNKNKIKAKQEDKILNEWRYLISNQIGKEVQSRSMSYQSFNEGNSSLSQQLNKSRFVLSEKPIDVNKKDRSMLYKQNKVAKMKEKQKAENALVIPLVLNHHKTKEYQKILDIAQLGIQAYAEIVKTLLFNTIPQQSYEQRSQSDEQYYHHIKVYGEYIQQIYKNFLTIKQAVQSFRELQQSQIPEVEISKILIEIILYQKLQKLDILGLSFNLFQIQEIDINERINQIKQLLPQCTTIEVNILTYLTSVVSGERCSQKVINFLENNSSVYTHYQQRQKDFIERMNEGIQISSEQDKQHKSIKILLDAINILMPYKILAQLKRDKMDLIRTLLQIIPETKINDCLNHAAEIYSQFDIEKAMSMNILSLTMQNNKQAALMLAQQFIEINDCESCLYLLYKRKNCFNQQQHNQYIQNCINQLSQQGIIDFYKIFGIKKQDLQLYSQEQIVQNSIKNYEQIYGQIRQSDMMNIMLNCIYNQIYIILINPQYSIIYDELLKAQQLQNKLLLNISINQARNEIRNNQINIQCDYDTTIEELEQKIIQYKKQQIQQLYTQQFTFIDVDDNISDYGDDNIELMSLQAQTTVSSYRSQSKKQCKSIFSMKNDSYSEENSYVDTFLQLQEEDENQEDLNPIYQSLNDQFNELKEIKFNKLSLEARMMQYKKLKQQSYLQEIINYVQKDIKIKESYNGNNPNIDNSYIKQPQQKSYEQQKQTLFTYNTSSSRSQQNSYSNQNDRTYPEALNKNQKKNQQSGQSFYAFNKSIDTVNKSDDISSNGRTQAWLRQSSQLPDDGDDDNQMYISTCSKIQPGEDIINTATDNQQNDESFQLLSIDNGSKHKYKQ